MCRRWRRLALSPALLPCAAVIDTELLESEREFGFAADMRLEKLLPSLRARTITELHMHGDYFAPKISRIGALVRATFPNLLK